MEPDKDIRSELILKICQRYDRVLQTTDKMSADFNVRVLRYLRWRTAFCRALYNDFRTAGFDV